MTYNDEGVYDTAYTYGNERIGIDILDGTRPDAQNPLYYLYDGEGSVSYITKPDGEIRDTYKYDEFGKPKTGKLSPDGDKILHTSFGYTGEQWDEESQLQYLRARYYDPEIGRFINRDTYQGRVRDPLSKNLYVYVQNNPINKVDPTGHRSIGMAEGTIIHNTLGAAFAVELGWQHVKFQKRDTFVDAKKRRSADLFYDNIFGQREVYEIKPSSYEKQRLYNSAKKQLDGYITDLNKPWAKDHYKHVYSKAVTGTTIYQRMLLSNGYRIMLHPYNKNELLIVYTRRKDGMIFYDVIDKPSPSVEPVRQPQTNEAWDWITNAVIIAKLFEAIAKGTLKPAPGGFFVFPPGWDKIGGSLPEA